MGLVRRFGSRDALLAAAGLLVLLAAPVVVYPVFLIKLLCFCLFACAFNLLSRSTGLLSFGHAAYFGAAAYAAGHAAKVWGFPFEAAIAFGTASGAVLGLVFGFLSVRRQGIYFAMITLALAQMIYFLALQLPFTHAEDGLTAIPRGRLLGFLDLNDDIAMYYTTAAIFLGGYLLIHRIVNSPFGRILRSIRENQQRAVSLGFRVDRYKIVAFTLSATLAGLAGSTKAVATHLATLTDVHWATSGDVLLMALLGGSETLFGPVVGAILVVTMSDYLAASGLPIPVVIGATFILCILLFRHGIVGEIQRLARWWMGRRGAA